MCIRDRCITVNFRKPIYYGKNWTDPGVVRYISHTPIAGFQFSVSDISITGISNGAAAEKAGFTVSEGNNTVIGFSFDGSTIPPGEGILVELEVTGSRDACLTDIVISDISGNHLNFDIENCGLIHIYGGDIIGCTDMDACNYDIHAAEDDGSCNYPSDCYDCDGGCTCEVDCAGDCGGKSEVDKCGVCNGDGSSCD